MTEDRYVAAMEIKEISDVEGGVGGQFIRSLNLSPALSSENGLGNPVPHRDFHVSVAQRRRPESNARPQMDPTEPLRA